MMKRRIPVFLALLLFMTSLMAFAQGETSLKLDNRRSNWELPADSSFNGVTMQLPYDGVAVYTGQQVDNEYVEYGQKIVSGDWVGLQMRQADPSKKAFDQECYMFRFSRSAVQLHKNKGGFSELTGEIATNVFADGAVHTVRAGAVREGDGVRLTLFVDGTGLIDHLDNTAPLTGKSYVSLYNYQSTGANFTLDDVYGEPEADSLFQPYDKKEYWNDLGRNSLSGSSMQLPYDGVAVYQHETPGNRLVEIDLQLVGGDWVGIQMRQANPSLDAFKQECYMFRISGSMVQLHKNKGGFGNLTGEIPTTVFADGKPHTVRAGVLSDGPATRLLLYVDGVKLIDCIDAIDPFVNDGPFSLYNYQNTQAVFTLKSYDPRQDIVDDGLGYTGGDVHMNKQYPAFQDGNVTKEPETTGTASTGSTTAADGRPTTGESGGTAGTTDAAGTQPGTGVASPSPVIFCLAGAGLLAVGTLLLIGRKHRRSQP